MPKLFLFDKKMSEEKTPGTAKEKGGIARYDAGANLNRVPVAIDQKDLVPTRHNKKYLLRVCQDYQITLKNLNALLTLEREYSSNLPSIIWIFKENFSPDQIENILIARSEISSEENPISLRRLVEFCKEFSLQSETPNLTMTIMDAADSYRQRRNQGREVYYYRFIDAAIETHRELKKEYGDLSLETVIGYITGEVFDREGK